ncbi:Ger(x)C family spore germination protein [Paenibacillus sp. GCM10012307]|uniref:Ger(X)C family spore germination protein n=1 Tax=Paenibacillus roseus TaxID=2798579 RepID=A0A934J4M7_9BACL|nr:Ger(x)C family spore germination protein [Paenibacillus roseus]MBJ6361458.1 Ger(x)C family spore germination protein [Paenibacillus roseus]
MRRPIQVALLLMCTALLAGCWDKAELIEFGYVQAVAVDKSGKEGIELTTLFYNPSGHGESTGMAPQPKMAIPIVTEASSVYEAVQDIPLHFGRRAKWDHMRIIMISEELARSKPLGEILDFFSRNSEQRATVLLLITRGKAKEYIKTKPYIEYTIGQQLRKIEETVSQYSAKTTKLPLYELAIQMMGQTNTAMIPYAYKTDKTGDIAVAGIALFKDQVLTGSIVSPADSQPLLMLLNRYNKGIIKLSCPESKGGKGHIRESFEIISIKTKLKPKIQGDQLTIQVKSNMRGSVSELHCTTLITAEEEQKMRVRVEEEVKSEMKAMIGRLQKRRLDVVNIGNMIYRHYPRLWKKWKPTWEERFATAKFDISIDVHILNTGLNIGETFGKKEKNE